MLAFLLFLLTVASLFAARQIGSSHFWKRLFWPGIGGALLSILLTIAVHLWGMPRGLSAQYFPNPTWALDSSVELERYFEPDGAGRRTDRIIDFNPNDFNNQYPFSGKIFTVKWEGWLSLPNAGTQMAVDSNFDYWLFIDDALVATGVPSPQALDIGMPEARQYLKKGWSFDEFRRKDEYITFAWATNDDTHLVLGIHEIADYEIVFRCKPFSFPDSPPQQVSVFLEGTQIGSVILADDWHAYTLPVPATIIEELGTGSREVIFRFSRVTKPSDVLADAKDTRELAAAFDTVELRQTSPGQSTTKLTPPTALEPGMHKIVLNARSSIANPYLRLLWQNANQTRPIVVAEDFLFPTTLSRESLLTVFAKERLSVTGLIGIESVVLLLLVSMLNAAAAPYICQPRRYWLSVDSVMIVTICGFAFLIRLFFMFEMKKIDPNFLILPDGTDHQNYLFFARGFFRGYWPGLTHEPFFQAPMISFYFIFCSLLFGEGMTKIRMMTALLSSLSVCFTFLIARRIFRRPVAYIAALLCACNGVLIFYDTSLLLEPLFIFLNLAGLWLMLQYKQHLSLSLTIATGALIGLASLTRSTVVLMLPFLLLWMLYWHWHSFKRVIGYFALLCLSIMVVVLPVTVRNYYSNPSHPKVLMNTNGGITFWIGNNASSNASYEWSSELEAETSTRIKTLGTSYIDEVLRFVKEQPIEYLRLEFKKLKYFWRGYEIANNIPYYIFRHTSQILGLPWVNFLLIGPLGLIGMIMACKRWNDVFLLYGYFCVQLLATLLFFALARYRLPVVHVLSIFAAYALWNCAETVRCKKWGALAAIILSFVVFYLAFNYPDAAKFYEHNRGTPMPISRVLRYWDLFYTW